MTYVEALIEVGGQLGMYLGLTALILFEICELTVRYVWMLCQKQCNQTAQVEASLDTSQLALLRKSREAQHITASRLAHERKALTNRLLSARRPVFFQPSGGHLR